MAATDNKSRLGRGLASLIGDASQINPAINDQITPVNIVSPAPVVISQDDGYKLVPIDMVSASALNPRKNFSPKELDELSASIKQRGVVQPLIVRPAPSGRGYELVAGERRWRAAQQAGVHQVPVLIRKLGDQEVLELAIIENVQRADLNAIEEAVGYRDLIERFNYSQDELAKIIGKSRTHLSNMMRLLKLPDSVQTLLRDGEISAGHARALVGRIDAEKIAQMIVEKGLSVRQVEALIKEASEQKNRDDDVMSVHDTDTLAVEKELADTLGLAVNIRKGNGQSGEIRVKYKTIDQFDD
ncbi:MAG: ParB/RepB/Spo0J family partition protein, partial [Hyphomicrobiaceae bacterium]|nr:ParB/RepB/Spo0J family partition protein [Hyphomicrobiaceae bacterium]